MQTIYWVLISIATIPSTFLALKWISKRTRTKKDDIILEEIDKIK